MTLSKLSTLAGVLASASLVAGHGYVTQIAVGGETYVALPLDTTYPWYPY
jgi:hypothetical protein